MLRCIDLSQAFLKLNDELELKYAFSIFFPNLLTLFIEPRVYVLLDFRFFQVFLPSRIYHSANPGPPESLRRSEVFWGHLRSIQYAVFLMQAVFLLQPVRSAAFVAVRSLKTQPRHNVAAILSFAKCHDDHIAVRFRLLCPVGSSFLQGRRNLTISYQLWSGYFCSFFTVTRCDSCLCRVRLDQILLDKDPLPECQHLSTAYPSITVFATRNASSVLMRVGASTRRSLLW